MFVGVGVTEAEMSFMFGHFTFSMIELNMPCKLEASRRDIKEYKFGHHLLQEDHIVLCV